MRNTGGGTLTWSVSNNAAWLSHTPTAGTGNGVVTISPATGSLAAGTYNGSVTLYATGATTINVPITLTITPAPQPTTGSVTLSWSPNSESDLAGYKVYRSTSSGGYGAPIATLPAGTTQYISSGLAKGSTYFFVITAYDQAGNESSYSNETSKSIY
jgi:fibronectin type 3 domain-containing protein